MGEVSRSPTTTAGDKTKTLSKVIIVREGGKKISSTLNCPFIANPDLPARLRRGWPLNEVDPATMYGGTDVGYIDYPTYAEAETEA